jgi:hypothetical protein
MAREGSAVPRLQASVGPFTSSGSPSLTENIVNFLTYFKCNHKDKTNK